MHARATLIMTTAGSEELARRLGSLLIREKLAACVQEVRITSRYRWKDEVQCDGEILLLVKTSAAAASAAMEAIRENHDYQVPEIIALPVTDGLPAYLDWICAETTGTASGL